MVVAGRRPTAEEIAAAAGTTIPDVIGPRLRVLFCGINPGLWSGATGRHFARPGNRFWPALHRSGFTERQLRPEEQESLLARGLGITNVAPRTTAKAEELGREELLEGGAALRARVELYRPRALAVLGIGAYRTAFGRPKAVIGRQDEEQWIGGTEVWVLPNPSGLNAHYSLDALADRFRELRLAVGADDASPTGGTGLADPAADSTGMTEVTRVTPVAPVTAPPATDQR